MFSAQLEKSREATDASNLRSAYAEVMTASLQGDSAHYSKEVNAKQTDMDDWANDNIDDIGGLTLPDPAAKWTVTYDPATETVSIS